MTPLTFEIQVSVVAPGRYRVASRTRRHGEAATLIRFDPDVDWLQDNRLLLTQGLMPIQQLEDFGAQLFSGIPDFGFDGLFSGTVLSHYRRCRGAASETGVPLRVHLHLEPPELEGLPWEVLCDPEEHVFLCSAAACQLVRSPASSAPVPSLAVSPPLQGLLVVAAAPDLHLQEEVASLLALGLAHPDRLTWEVLQAPSASDLRAHLERRKVHILHFCGHASSSADGEAQLELAPGRSLEARTLALMAQKGAPPRLVVLNGCGTGQRDSSRAFSGAGQRLLEAGVPAVVATCWAVQDASARLFSEAFYQALLDPSGPADVVQAMTAARHRLQVERGPQCHDFGAYSLYLRAREQHLLALPRKGDEPQPPALRATNATAKPLESLPTSEVLPVPVWSRHTLLPQLSKLAKAGSAWWTRGTSTRWLLVICLTVLPLLRLRGCFDPADAAREWLYGRLEGPIALDQDLVIVDLDSLPVPPLKPSQLLKTQQPLWTRQALARLVERLVADPPVRGVVLDLHLGPQPPTDEPLESVQAHTERLGKALETFLGSKTIPPRVVVLARHARLEPAASAPNTRWRYDLERLEPLASPLAGLPWGYAALLTSPLTGSVARGVPLSARVHHPGERTDRQDAFALSVSPLVRPHGALMVEGSRLALAPSRLRSSEPSRAWVQADDRLRVELPHVPERWDGPAWVTGSRLLAEGPDADALKQELAGRLAVVGYASSPDLDRVETLWGPRPGVLVQAGLLSTLYQGRAPWRAPSLDLALQGIAVVGGVLLTRGAGKQGRRIGMVTLGVLCLEWYAWRGLDLRLHGPVPELMALALWGQWEKRRKGEDL